MHVDELNVSFANMHLRAAEGPSPSAAAASAAAGMAASDGATATLASPTVPTSAPTPTPTPAPVRTPVALASLWLPYAQASNHVPRSVRNSVHDWLEVMLLRCEDRQTLSTLMLVVELWRPFHASSVRYVPRHVWRVVTDLLACDGALDAGAP